MLNELQDRLNLTYADLEEMNLQSKADRAKPAGQIQEARLKYLTDEKRISRNGALQ